MTDTDHAPKHRKDVPVDSMSEAHPVPCKHHLFMRMCRGEQVDPCPNLSEWGSLYCTSHQTHPPKR